MLRMWNYFVNHLAPLAHKKDGDPQVLAEISPPVTRAAKDTPSPTVWVNTVHLFWNFLSEHQNTFFLLPSKAASLTAGRNPMVEIFMRRSAGEDKPQHNQGLYSPGSRGKSVPVLLSDACLKHIKTKTGSVISQGEYVRRSLQDKSWGKADQSCAQRQKETEAALFQWLSLPSDLGGGGLENITCWWRTIG